MKIVQLTPGTGTFYCGSCLRDHTLVKAMRRLGHDVLLAPLYLPMVLDELLDEPVQPLRFGGVNVFLQQASALFSRTPRWFDNMLDSTLLLRVLARFADMTSASQHGEMAISMLRGADGRQGKELDKLIEQIKALGRVDVVKLSNVLLIGAAERLRDELGVPVVCTLHGEEGFIDALPDPCRAQVWDLLQQHASDVNAFVAVSQYYADRMVQRLALSRDMVHVVHNGIAIDEYPGGGRVASDGVDDRAATAQEEPPTIGFLARMHPGKGLHTLVNAYLIIRASERVPNVRLRIAGAKTRGDAAYVRDLARRMRGHDVEFEPNISRERKIEWLRDIDVLSVPALGEAFGLYVLEAWAAGVPVVGPRDGALVELLEKTGAGMLCAPDDSSMLAKAIESLLCDRKRARALGECGRRAVLEHFNADRMAQGVSDVCERCLTNSK